MKLISFILWLSTGAVIGWFASRMVRVSKLTPKTVPVKVSSTEKG